MCSRTFLICSLASSFFLFFSEQAVFTKSINGNQIKKCSGHTINSLNESHIESRLNKEFHIARFFIK